MLAHLENSCAFPFELGCSKQMTATHRNPLGNSNLSFRLSGECSAALFEYPGIANRTTAY